MPNTLHSLVNKWKAAELAYNSDCNVRPLDRPDAKRQRLSAASGRAYKAMVRHITAESARRKP